MLSDLRISAFLSTATIKHLYLAVVCTAGVGTRTTKWINMTNHLIIHNSNYNTVKAFLDSDKVGDFYFIPFVIVSCHKLFHL